MNSLSSATVLNRSEDTHTPESRMPRKVKRRTNNEAATPGSQQICHITRLPLEILAEVLSFTTPRDILALARSNKYFCATLVKSSCDFIWKKARSRYSPTPIPDPTPNFTEASYAAFIFDYGVCEVCKKKTKAMYASFTLRLRLCTRAACELKWRTESVVEIRPSDTPRYRKIAERLPSAEYRNFGHSSSLFHRTGIDAVELSFMFRKSQWQTAVDEYNKIALDNALLDKYKSEHTNAVQRLQECMELGKKLVKWRVVYDDHSKAIHKMNLALAKSTAEATGWQLWDLLQTPSYALLYYSKNKSLETIAHREFDVIRSSVEDEITQIVETRQRREAENAYRKQRADVAQYYTKLKKSSGDSGVLPILPEFRKLPAVQLLHPKLTDQIDSAVHKHRKKSKFVDELINQDVSKWQGSTKTAFAALLGFPNWKDTSTKVLQPAIRLNARFKCKKCSAKSRSDWVTHSMSFVEACNHHCAGLSKKQKAKETWRVSNFDVDLQAANVVDQLLMWCGVDAQYVDSLKVIEEVGTRILCLSCSSTIIMNFEMMLSHCNRHDNMRIELLPQSQVETFIKRPIEYGLRAQLTQHSPSSKELREKRVYGCRHCEQPRRAGVPTEGPGAPTTALSAADHVLQAPTHADSSNKVEEKTRGSRPKAGQGKPMKMFSFDGLRSHVKEKHGVVWIGDEDFYKEIDDDNTPNKTAASVV